MEGLILAAGLGTRLRPLTDSRPKALVDVGGRPLLQIAIERLAAAGVEHVVVNTHHMAGMVAGYLASRRWPCRVEVSDESGHLLDTGGALSFAARLFSGSDDVLVHNVDVLSTVDLAALEACHRGSGNTVTLCVSRRHTSRLLAFSGEGQLLGRYGGGAEGLPPGAQALAFSGISMVAPRLFGLLPPPGTAFPAIDRYIDLARSGERIGRFEHDAAAWLDVGKPETLKIAEQWSRSFTK